MLGSLLKAIRFSVATLPKPNKKAPVLFKRWNIVRNDKVMVRAGAYRGKISRVIRVLRKTNQVVVQGVNVRVKP